MSRKHHQRKVRPPAPGPARPSAQETAKPLAPEPARSLDLEAAARDAIASPEYRSLPARTQAALRSRDPVEIKWALFELARVRAIHSAYFDELPDSAQTAIFDGSEAMPGALVLLNEIRTSKPSRDAERPASWEPVVEEIDEVVAPPEPAEAGRELVSEETFEVLSPAVRAASELALEKPKPQPKRKWKSAEQLRISPEEVIAQLDEADVRHAAENSSTLPELPEAPTAAQAAAWLEDILMRRTLTPKPGKPYRVPDLVPGDDGFATGSSIIEGDAPVNFPMVEVRHGKAVVIFGPEGSKYGRDMPFVSDQLKQSVIEAIRRLPGYTELCEVTGNRLSQPLGTITHKLLRGEIRRWQDIHFITKSKEAIEEEKRQRTAERDAQLAAEKDRDARLWEKLIINLSIDPEIRESAAQLRALSKVSTESAADQPWNVSLPAKAIIAQVSALREGVPEPAGALTSLFNAG